MSSQSNINAEYIRICISDILTYARIYMYGAIFAFGIYCINVMVAVGYLYQVSTQLANKKILSRRERVLSIYVILAFIASTFSIAGGINQATGYLSSNCDLELGLVSEEVNGGLPASFFITNYMFAAGFMLTAWAVDAIMIWRFLAIYHDFRLVKWNILAFSSLLLMGSIAVGGLQAIDGTDTNIYLLVLEATSLFQNMLLTTFIIGRLLLVRYRIRKVLGTRHGSEYINVTTMLVESQALLGAGQVALLATALNKYGNIMYQVVGQLQVLSPIILIYRVMQGKTCDSKTIAELGTLKFNNDTQKTQA
ncbi:hypothetical protein BDQ17DRAFT_1382037 [Cyathus striatus]|nr:hypothetical protein BDQ17DRAFT_1382037 [Cyathus striatus]